MRETALFWLPAKFAQFVHPNILFEIESCLENIEEENCYCISRIFF